MISEGLSEEEERRLRILIGGTDSGDRFRVQKLSTGYTLEVKAPRNENQAKRLPIRIKATPFVNFEEVIAEVRSLLY